MDFNSEPIKISNISLPSIGYYNNDTSKYCGKDTITANLSSTLNTNLNKNCEKIESYLFSDKEDVYNKTIAGTLDNEIKDDNNVKIEDKSNLLTKEINSKCNATNTSGQKSIVDQIKYLSCQLAASRNRTYNLTELDVTNSDVSVKQIFEKFSNIKIYLVLIFFLTFYFLTQGLFSSLDVSANLVNLVADNSSKNWLYWIGLFLGLTIPVFVLASLFISKVCGNITELENINITTNPNGVKDKLPSSFSNIDTGILFLFLLFIYGFVAVIFTVKKESVGDTFYLLIIGTILFIISIFIYIFYTFTPFFSGNNIDKVNDFNIPLKLYVENQEDVNNITTNQTQLKNIQDTFLTTGIIVFVFFLIFIFLGKKKDVLPIWLENLFNGFFGASAILISPILWVFNLIIALKYFYIFPIILLGFRFIRYFGMGLLYIINNNSESFKDGISSNLEEQLDNFKEYTPTWNLLGFDLIKATLNIFGYENIFSEKFTNNNNISKNLSSNKYVIPSIFSYIFLKVGNDDVGSNGTKNVILQLIISILSIIISCITLFGYYKI
jgi:hypothetical protein